MIGRLWLYVYCLSVCRNEIILCKSEGSYMVEKVFYANCKTPLAFVKPRLLGCILCTLLEDIKAHVMLWPWADVYLSQQCSNWIL